MSLATEVAIKIECKQPKWYLDEEKKNEEDFKSQTAMITSCQLYNNIVTKFHSMSWWSLNCQVY